MKARYCTSSALDIILGWIECLGKRGEAFLSFGNIGLTSSVLSILRS